MDEEQTKICSNCKREIASANFTMHELHCVRNIVLCKACNEPVPRSQMKEHEDTIHALVKCPMCSEEVEKSKLEVHEEQLCDKRQVKCPVCEMEVHFDSFVEHLDYCESRTQECLLCHQYIMMKDLEQHEASNCQYPERVVRRQSETDDIAEGSSGGGDGPPSYMRESSFAAKELHRILNFPYVDFDRTAGAYDADYHVENADLPASLDGERTMLPCEFCNSLFSSDMIFAHQSSCPRDPSAEGNQLAQLLRSGMSMNHPQPRFDRPPYVVEDSDDDVVDQGAALVTDDSVDTPLPCEFCEELYPMSELPQHQGVCPRDTLRSARGPRTAVIDAFQETAPSQTVEDILRPIAVGRAHDIGTRRDEFDSAAAAMRRESEAFPLRYGVGMWSSEPLEPLESNTGRRRTSTEDDRPSISRSSRAVRDHTELVDNPPRPQGRRAQGSRGGYPGGSRGGGRGSTRSRGSGRPGNGLRNTGNRQSRTD